MSKEEGQDPNAQDNQKAWLQSLSPDEREAVRSYAWDRLFKARKVNVNGKSVSLKALADQVAQEREQLEHGVYDEDVRAIPRWQAQELVPSSQLRPGAEKQMLKEEEEDALELQRMGNGNMLSARKVAGAFLPKQRDFAFGIFARPDRVESVLRDSWAGCNPEATLAASEFYTDILRRCHQVELTLMLLTSRPLPVAELRPAVQHALQQGMQRLAGVQKLEQQDESDLHQFITLFDDQRIAKAAWVDRGRVKQGTHVIFSTTPKGGLAVEAITPGPLRNRKTSFIGTSRNPLITGALFDAFLGPQPIDAGAKRNIGAGMLWAANGLKFKPGQHPNQHMGRVTDSGEIKLAKPEAVERLPATTSVFRLLDDGMKPVRMLLNSIAGGSAGATSTERSSMTRPLTG